MNPDPATTPDPLEPAGRGLYFQLALATFGILALELAIIRWLGSQIRIFAYFSNLTLIACFLGMGLGVALGRRRPGLVHGTLPLLAILSSIIAASDALGISKVHFPDSSIAMWGGELWAAVWQWALGLSVMLGLFWLIVAVFLCAGSAVGSLFGRLPPLRAYSWDLSGSLLGIIVTTGVTALRSGPPFWLLPGCVAFTALSRRRSSVLSTVLILALAAISAMPFQYSPYNALELTETTTPTGVDYTLAVNRDFHQSMFDLSDAAIHNPRLSAKDLKNKQSTRLAYEIPFGVNPLKDRALIVGAGTGNDVEAALRSGYRSVWSVDIDPQIIQLGTERHPEQPYSDPRVVPVVNDARAFFEQYDGPQFDVVCYGLVDSHALFSAMSTVRLESFVYTEEGIRAAWRHVAPAGHLSISFSVYAGDWIADRLYWTILAATGVAPVMIHTDFNYGRTYIVARPQARLQLDSLRATFPFPQPTSSRDEVRSTSDDWPFLYVRPGQFPWGYAILLLAVLLTGFFAARAAFGRQAFTVGGFHLPLFLMGAAFLLLETRGVTSLSILFGSTWLVNSAVFAGILVMALLANILVMRSPPRHPLGWFLPLLACVALVWLFPVSVLNRLPMLARGALGGVLVGLPIGFAGIVVSALLGRARDPSGALGSNLLGALVGGCIEYLSMWLGLPAMAGIALCFYLAAMIALWRRERSASDITEAAPPGGAHG